MYLEAEGYDTAIACGQTVCPRPSQGPGSLYARFPTLAATRPAKRRIMSNRRKQTYLGDLAIKHARAELVTLGSDQAIDDALASLRKLRLNNRVVYFYVTDKDNRLVGVVPVRRLLMASPDAPVSSIMIKEVVSVPKDATVLTACEAMLDNKLLAVPIVDAKGRLSGAVDITLFTDEVWSAAKRHRADDVFQLIGVHLALDRELPVWSNFIERFRWLLCNIAGGLGCAVIASFYESLMGTVTLLAIFIPVVLALSESVSMQSMTIALQVLPQKAIRWRLVFSALRRELSMAAVLGAGAGGVVGALALLWKGQPRAAMAIGISIWLGVLSACLLGVAIPAATRALRVDPEVAAGPVILATADILTLAFYFSLAGRLLG